MKILRYILLASLTCALSACEKDEMGQRNNLRDFIFKHII